MIDVIRWVTLDLLGKSLEQVTKKRKKNPIMNEGIHVYKLNDRIKLFVMEEDDNFLLLILLISKCGG